MKVDDYFGLGKPTTNIGLGCGRLVGRDGLRESAAIVEAALELGIRHFDVAPSYGMGTAEEVLGVVLASVADVTITTKVGIQRAAYSRRRAVVRRVAKPLLDRRRTLKALARRAAPTGTQREPFVFSSDAIRRSLEESLEKLRRESVDAFLLHEPLSSDLNAETEHCLDLLAGQGLFSTYGVGIDARSPRWREFGSIWQSRWPGDALDEYRDAVSYVFHGAVRYAAESDGPDASPGDAVRAALERAPRAVLLVSASTPGRLRELVEWL